MRIQGTILGLMIIVFTMVSGAAEPKAIGNGQYNDDLLLGPIPKEIEKSVVKIEIPSPGGSIDCKISTGTGFFLETITKLETAAHVLTLCSSSQINFEDSTINEIIISNSYFIEPLVIKNVKIIKFDTKTDRATLNLTRSVYKFPFEIRSLKKSQQIPTEGESLLVVGYPNRIYNVIQSAFSKLVKFKEQDFFVIDSDVQGGASGGPTLNSDFEVIGVNTGIYVPDIKIKKRNTGKALISII